MHRHCDNRAPVDIHGLMQTTGKTRCPGGVSVSCSASRTRHDCPRHNKSVYIYIWRLDTGRGPTLNRKFHSHNTPGKMHNNTCVEPLAGNCTTEQSLNTNYFLSAHATVVANIPLKYFTIIETDPR